MQTFLPYPDFAASVATLDRQRLGKQRVETLQLLYWLHGVKMVDPAALRMVPRLSKWNHPAAGMWSGHEQALLRYQEATCNEWTSRGYKDTCLAKSRFVVETLPLDDHGDPSWLGDPDFHARHRSNLLRKDEGHYRQFFSQDPVDLDYVWPKGVIPLRTRLDDAYEAAIEELGL